MFATDKKSLVSTLRKIRERICVYHPHIQCDCKYTSDPNLGRRGGEGTGCCEIRLVTKIIEVMTEEEYEEILKREYP